MSLQPLTPDATVSPFDPLGFETELGPLPLAGEWPAGLRGTLVRNGPNPVVPSPEAHWFEGDGMLHAFHAENGKVHYRNRWVRTARLAAQRQSGRSRSKGFEPSAASVDDGAANTHVISHAGRMLALEEAHLPIEIDPDSLGTLGPVDFDGDLQGAFTAHPKTDPKTGELLFFGYGTPARLSAGMSFGVLSPAGKVTRFERFDGPYASMVHDFMVTEHFVMFPVMPLTGSLDRAKKGLPPYAWEPSLDTHVGVMPRNGSTSDIVWWTGPACYMFHVMNAWEAGGQLHADVMQYDAPPLFPLSDGSPGAEARSPAYLVRWSFDLEGTARSFTRTQIDPVAGEFPRIDDRYAGRPYRHGWYASNVVDGEDSLRMVGALRHVDHRTGRRKQFRFDAPDRASEPVFVPRSADAPEGDGWLLSVIWRGLEDRSDLAVFDAQDLERGPLCTAALPHRVPAGFHGSWFGEA